MNTIYAYSLVRALYDEKKDYIDTFLPLVVSVIPEGKQTKKNEIQANVKKEYGLNIPLYSLEIILRRGKKYEYLQITGEAIAIIEQGLLLKNKFNVNRGEQRRINELIENATAYLANKVEIKPIDVQDLFFNFIQSNLHDFDLLLGNDSNGFAVSRKRYSAEIEQHLSDYIVYIEENTPVLFSTLQDIILGSLISASVYSNTFGDFSQKFDKITAYLDTNIILSLFDLHHDVYSKPVKELYSLMVESKGFSFRIFDFTIEEIINVLRKYISEGINYIDDIPVDSIYSKLKRLGWTNSTVTEFIHNIETNLANKKIIITPTTIKLRELKFEDIQIEEISKYKPYQIKLSQNHDLIAIEKISKLRVTQPRKIETCGYLFLTSDVKLAKFNYDSSHKNNGTINEVIPDRLLTNLLWLKQPKKDIKVSLASIISAYKTGQFINHAIWDRFIKTVKSLRNRDAISVEDVGTLLYDSHIMSSLKDISHDQYQTIDDDFVLEKIHSAKKIELEDRKNAFDKLKKDTSTLKQEVSNNHKELDELMHVLTSARNAVSQTVSQQEMILSSIETRISKSKTENGIRANKYTNAVVNLIKFIIVIISISIAYKVIPIVKKSWNDLEPIIWILSILIGFLAYLGFRVPFVSDAEDALRKKVCGFFVKHLSKRNYALLELENELKSILSQNGIEKTSEANSALISE